jgi:predicted dehydrogenase
MTGKGVQRRSVIGGMAAGAAALAARTATAAPANKKRYVIVGSGHRSRMYQDAIWGPHKDTAELVAVCDKNPGRAAYVQKRASDAGAAPPRTYLHTDFDKMVREMKPDTVIVTTPCAIHAEYIVRALDLGLEVITEKAMTTTPDLAQRILDATKRNNRHIRVTFNYRYSPFRTQVKELLMSGEIGDILSVDFHWLLDTTHGADYFRRWHSHKAMSGGLMVHKATHHFDLVNWWLSAMPVTVNATGKREFYTPKMAKRFGLQGEHQRCRTCPEKADCSFYLDIGADPALKAMYVDAEQYDGYYRDQCVWREAIDIEDTMNVIVGYDSGATLSYSLNACNAWEGYMIAFNGTKGRLEHSLVESTYVTGAAPPPSDVERATIRVMPLRGEARNVPVRFGEKGGHGGGDAVMLAELFGSAPADPTLRAADERAGAASCLIGIAANRCFETGLPVKIADLVTGLERPHYTKMPTRNEQLPMPAKARRG